MKKSLQKIWLHAKKHYEKIHHKDTSKLTLVKYAFIGLVGLFIFIVFLTLAIVIPTLPDIDDIQNLVAEQSSVILDREGEVLYTIHGDENRKIVPLEEISPYAPKAIMSIEDDQFYTHMGIDVGAIFKALCSELGVCSQRGGSTITQQFVKNAFLSPERTYTRKLKEIILALQIESKYEKDEIMEMYLNRIAYGSNIYGIEVAAQTFFGKPALELTVAESAVLAAIPKATTHYSPYGNYKYAQVNIDEEEILRKGIESEQDLVDDDPDNITKGLLGKTYTFGEEGDARDIYVKGRVDFVVSRMEELGYVTEEEGQAAIEEAGAIEFLPYREDIKAPHFVMYVKELLEQEYGKDQVEKGGLKITTTINGAMQDAADKAVEDHAERNATNYLATNAALVAMDPDNGQILAMVGSADFWNDEIDGKVNVSLRSRLPGSSFKPIAYAAAFLQGYAPSTVVYDVRTKFGSWYEPENFDGKFRGPVTFRSALGGSLNIPAIKATYLAGIPNVLDLARKLGLGLDQGDDWYGLSLGLGAGEARLIDMVGAYSVFANGGYKSEPVAILKIEDRNGNIIEEYEEPKRKDLILDPQVAYLINDILSDREARPDEFWRNRLTIPGFTNGAKTGTSNKEKNDVNYPFDTWTIGYTRNLVGGVWAGNANGDQLSLLASGLDVAAPIWRQFMIDATKDMEKKSFDRPEGIKWVKVAKRSGNLPSEHTPADETVTGIFASFNVPREYDSSYQLVEIDKVSGKLATEYTPKEAIEEKAFFSHHSIIPDNANWENAVRAWAEENDEDEEVPTEYDDVHTPDNVDSKPLITITSPSSHSEVSPPSVGVWVDIDASEGVNKVEYYWDDELVYTADNPPYKGVIEISSSTKKGSEHDIKAIVYDGLYISNQAAIEVKIGEDEMLPVVEFTYPDNKDKFSAGELMVAQVDAYDPNGDIEKVEFYLNGDLKETVKAPPFVWQFTMPENLDKHDLKAIAYDYAGNKNDDEIKVESVASTGNLSGDSRIYEPSKNTSFNIGESVLIKAYISEDERADLDEVIVMVKGDSAIGTEIASASGDANTYSFIWSSPNAGTYELYLKVVLDNGKIRFSKRVPVVVR